MTINGTKCKVQDEDDEEDPKPYDTKSVVRLVVDETSLKLQERRYSGPGHEFKPIFIEPIGGYKGLYFVDPKDERLEYLEEDDDTNSNELKDEGLAGHFAIRTEGTYIQLVKQKLDSASYTFRLGEIDNGPAGKNLTAMILLFFHSTPSPPLTLTPFFILSFLLFHSPPPHPLPFFQAPQSPPSPLSPSV